MTTGFLAQEDLKVDHWRAEPSPHALVAAAWALAGLGTRTDRGLQTPAALWLAPSFQTGAQSLRNLGAAACEICIAPQADGAFLLTGGNSSKWSLHAANFWQGENEIGFALDGVFRRIAWFQPDPDSVWVQDGADAWRYQRVIRFDSADDAGDSGLQLFAPMSGRAIALPVVVGDAVEVGTALVVMESMKMEMPLCAGGAGRVARILVDVGAQLTAGQLLVELETA